MATGYAFSAESLVQVRAQLLFKDGSDADRSRGVAVTPALAAWALIFTLWVGCSGSASGTGHVLEVRGRLPGVQLRAGTIRVPIFDREHCSDARRRSRSCSRTRSANLIVTPPGDRKPPSAVRMGALAGGPTWILPGKGNRRLRAAASPGSLHRKPSDTNGAERSLTRTVAGRDQGPRRGSW